MKGISCRQQVCLHSLIFKRCQAGRAAAFSRIRRFGSSLLNLSWVLFLNQTVSTHSWQSHCALCSQGRALSGTHKAFPRICGSHFRKHPHFMCCFFNLCMRPIQRVYLLLATDNDEDKCWSVVLARTGELLLFLLQSCRTRSGDNRKAFRNCSKESGCSPLLFFSWKSNFLLSPAGMVITFGQAFLFLHRSLSFQIILCKKV